jgi:hypothetical protein
VLSNIKKISTSLTSETSQNFPAYLTSKHSDNPKLPNYTTCVALLFSRPSNSTILSKLSIIKLSLSDEIVVAVFVSQKRVSIEVSHMIDTRAIYMYMHFNNIKTRVMLYLNDMKNNRIMLCTTVRQSPE